MIELAILGLLKEGALHGYELKKRLRHVLGGRAGVSFGSLYPALNRLERDGAVAAVTGGSARSTPAMPMTGSFAGEAAAFRSSRRVAARGPRNKKVYGITTTGEARLTELIADPSDDERSFRVKVAFCRFAGPDTRLRLLERRRAALVERLSEGRATMGTPGLDRYVRSLLQHDTESTEHDIAWLDHLLTDERTLLSGQDAPAPGAGAPSAPAGAVHAPPARDLTPRPAPPAFPTHQPSPLDGSDTAATANGGIR